MRKKLLPGLAVGYVCIGLIWTVVKAVHPHRLESQGAWPMKQRALRLLVGLAGLAVLGFLSVLWVTAPKHNITPVSVEAIRVGMTRTEVETLLGGPAGNYSRDDTLPLYGGKLFDTYETWVGDDVSVFVWFGDDAAVSKSVVAGVFRREAWFGVRRLRCPGL